MLRLRRPLPPGGAQLRGGKTCVLGPAEGPASPSASAGRRGAKACSRRSAGAGRGPGARAAARTVRRDPRARRRRAREVARRGSGPSAGGRPSSAAVGAIAPRLPSHEASVADRRARLGLRLRLEGGEPARGESLQQRRGRGQHESGEMLVGAEQPGAGEAPGGSGAWAASASRQEPAMASAATAGPSVSARSPAAAARPVRRPGPPGRGRSGSRRLERWPRGSRARAGGRSGRRRRGRSRGGQPRPGSASRRRRRVGRSRSVPHRRGAR